MGAVASFLQCHLHKRVHQEKLAGTASQCRRAPNHPAIGFHVQIFFPPLQDMGLGLKEQFQVFGWVKIGKGTPIGDAIEKRRLQVMLF